MNKQIYEVFEKIEEEEAKANYGNKEHSISYYMGYDAGLAYAKLVLVSMFPKLKEVDDEC